MSPELAYLARRGLTVLVTNGALSVAPAARLTDLDRAELKYPAFLPATHPHLAEVETAQPADMFAALKQRDVLLQLFMVDKALYELNYELNNRPDWVRIPVRGILSSFGDD